MSSEKLEPEVGENIKAFKQVRLVRALDIGYTKYTYVQEHLEQIVSVFACSLTS